MFLVNSRPGLFTATAGRSGGKLHHRQRRSFSRSYGANLPSSLTRVLSRALGFSPCLPVSVCGTGTVRHSLEVFPGSVRSVSSPPLWRLPTPLRVCGWRICLPSLLRAWPRSTNDAGNLPCCVAPSVLRQSGGAGILTCCPSPTAFALGLGPTNLKRTSLA